MPEPLVVNKSKTAVLCMDCQNDIVKNYPSATEGGMLKKTSAVLEAARKAGIPVIYVVVRFREGYPEVSPRNTSFSGIKKAGILREGTPGGEIHADVAPRPGDIIVTKRRVGAFSTTDMNAVLSGRGAETIVLMGIATSGVVLSTVRHAADADFGIVVLSDCCADRDPEVHRVLLEKVFPRQATVTTSDEFIKAVRS